MLCPTIDMDLRSGRCRCVAAYECKSLYFYGNLGELILHCEVAGSIIKPTELERTLAATSVTLHAG